MPEDLYDEEGKREEEEYQQRLQREQHRVVTDIAPRKILETKGRKTAGKAATTGAKRITRAGTRAAVRGGKIAAKTVARAAMQALATAAAEAGSSVAMGIAGASIPIIVIVLIIVLVTLVALLVVAAVIVACKDYQWFSILSRIMGHLSGLGDICAMIRSM